MSPAKSHEALVGRQFGTRAAAYLSSAVHAQGADLESLSALVEDDRRAQVLDLGCGAGHVSFAVAPRAKSVVAYDLSADMLDVVARAAKDRGLSNITTRQGVAEHLPFPDASFDRVLSRYSAHHWRDIEAGLREAARVLKPGAVAGFVDTVSPGAPLLDTYLQGIELLRDLSHVRDYSRAEWEAALGARRPHPDVGHAPPRAPRVLGLECGQRTAGPAFGLEARGIGATLSAACGRRQSAMAVIG
jgi:SAM-dependent methyltransferase